jgi:hypothetical protein
MLHVDIPTPADLKALITYRGDICASIYLRTTPVSQGSSKDRIELKVAAKQAIDELEASGADKRRVAALREQLDDLVDDDEFWRYQAHSLAVLATPDNVRTFRLPSALEPLVEVSDRFHLKPLLRAVTFPNACYILALDQGPSRLIEVSADLPAEEVKVDGMPRDAASAVGKSSLADRSPSGRIQGSEGQKVRLRQFARKVDNALRGILTGSDVPLVLATTEPLESIYRSVNTYTHLALETIEGSPAELSDAQLAERARPILDGIYRAQLADWTARFAAQANRGRTTSDIAQAARAATAGAVESILVNIDEIVHGTVDADGAVTFADGAGPDTYGIVDEISDRVILSGGQVLAVRQADIPEGKSLAAILRYAI